MIVTHLMKFKIKLVSWFRKKKKLKAQRFSEPTVQLCGQVLS